VLSATPAIGERFKGGYDDALYKSTLVLLYITYCVYHASHGDIQPLAWAAHPYCSVWVDSAFRHPSVGKMYISPRAE